MKRALVIVFGAAAFAFASLSSSAAPVAELDAFFSAQRSQLRADARPLPATVRERMARYFPPATLAAAHYVVAPASVARARSVLANPATRAVVFFDLVVFASEADTRDMTLWASQLQHVRMQVERGKRGALADYARPVAAFNSQTAAIERQVAKDQAAPPAATGSTSTSTAARSSAQVGAVPKGTKFMVHTCNAGGLTCELGVFQVQAPGETIPCSCRDSLGMMHEGTAF